MPFKSEAQRRKFAELVKQGKMDKKVFNEWNSDTPKKIPERIGPTGTDRIRQVKKVKIK